jgi:two-component system chemotaxis response regulator CheB
VLVIDDSAFARKVLREVLASDPRLEVVGFARDGADALEKIAELRPDVITLDLIMPDVDGVAVLQALHGRPDAPKAVIVSMTEIQSEVGVSALAAGAFEVVHKPTALATDRLYELAQELIEKVVMAAEARAPRRASIPAVPPRRAAAAQKTRVVVIGASTGGPRAVSELIVALPKDFPVPVAVALHMPVGYTEAFARRLAGQSSLRVREASQGDIVRPGDVLVARAGVHLKLRHTGEDCVAVLDPEPSDSLHRPSVDALFKSAAAGWGSGVLGVVLTGMGNDGAEGARAIHDAGGRVLTESESTCVVYGMPRAVAEQGLSEAELPLGAMAAAVLARL